MTGEKIPDVNIRDLHPKSLWKHFSDIAMIPRPSKHEHQITAYMQKFGNDLGLETIVDEVGNVLIRKPATLCMENRKGVVLQGHLDMVPQKHNDVTHDFLKDPIKPYVDGDWVKAKGTTLGSDNGIGVAAIMAILEAQDINHGPLEALFTVDEEAGFTGAHGFKPGILKGDILLNLDTQIESEFFIGAAGGIYTDAKFRYSEVPVPKGVMAYNIKAHGFHGGHSGVNIINRGNANKTLIRFLLHCAKNYGMRLASISGGWVHNAIPREASAVITIPKENEMAFLQAADQFEEMLRIELSTADPEVKLDVLPTDLPSLLIDEKNQYNFLIAMHSCVNGVVGMSCDVPGLVETSTSLAKIHSENGEINVGTLQRSLVDSLLDSISDTINCTFLLAGGEVKQYSKFPGWKPDVNSEILHLATRLYREKFSLEPTVKAVHAGLECGSFKTKYPHLDILSYGPTIKFAHSPDEMVDVKTVVKFWDTTIEILKHIPEKNN